MKVGGGTDIKWTTDSIDLNLNEGGNSVLILTAPATGYVPIGWYDHMITATNSLGIVEKLQYLSGNYRIVYYNTTTLSAIYKATVHTAWVKE
jgi:hypothetical protein